MDLGRPFRRASRQVRDSALFQRFVAWTLGLYLTVVFNTTRWGYVGRAHLEAMWAQGGFVAAVWHGRLFPIAKLRLPDRRALALISPNRDGDLLARVIEGTGAETVRGSSRDPKKPDKSTGSGAATPVVLAALKEGAVLVITPDGPRGPRMRAKVGAAMFSAAAGAPILPVAFSVRRGFALGTWDRFLLPLPFNRGVFVFGEPIAPLPDTADRAAVEAQRAAVEAAVTAATEQADRLLGRDTPPAGPALDPARAGASSEVSA